MSLAMHCDRDDCDTWQRLPNSNPLWLTLSSKVRGSDNHFCSLDCLLHWTAANSEPTEAVQL